MHTAWGGVWVINRTNVMNMKTEVRTLRAHRTLLRINGSATDDLDRGVQVEKTHQVQRPRTDKQ